MTSPPEASLPEASPPEISTFQAAAETFLARHYPRKTGDEPAPFVWGEGDDSITVFQEPDRTEEMDALARIRGWRATLWDHGYGWISGPAELGGAGLPPAYEQAFQRVARTFDVPGDAALTISLGMVAPTLRSHGTPEQQQYYLPRLYRGDLIACQLFSEPGAGSDLASLSTRAVRQGESWRITGQKVWTSGAHLADVGAILCRTSDGARHRNLTMFIVDMQAAGVSVRPLRQMTGGASFNEVFLDDVVVPDANRIGDEGAGWTVAMTTLANERNAMGASAFGGVGLLSTDRLIEMIRHNSQEDDPLVRRAFGELIMELRAARYRQEILNARAKAGAPPTLSAALNKLALSANMARLAEFVTQVLGPRVIADTGAWGTYAWTSVLLGAPGYRLGGGTDEVLKNMVAQRVLGLPKPR